MCVEGGSRGKRVRKSLLRCVRDKNDDKERRGIQGGGVLKELKGTEGDKVGVGSGSGSSYNKVKWRCRSKG